MLEYRITKYNPQFRDSNGVFVRNEWTSFSDIGKPFDDGQLQSSSYLKIEEAYVEAVLLLLYAKNLSKLQVRDLDFLSSKSIYQEGQWINRDEIADVTKRILREELWCRLEHGRKFFAHFGYDFYMYVGVAGKKLILPNLSPLLFIEEMRSPWHRSAWS